VSTLLSRFVVCLEFPVLGPVTAETVAAWIDSATGAYLDRCPPLRRPGLLLRKRTLAHPPAAMLGEPDSVIVSASAAEVHLDSFTMSLRIRSAHDTALNAKCVVTLADSATGGPLPVTNDIRDQLIALEHAAEHFN